MLTIFTNKELFIRSFSSLPVFSHAHSGNAVFKIQNSHIITMMEIFNINLSFDQFVECFAKTCTHCRRCKGCITFADTHHSTIEKHILEFWQELYILHVKK